MQDSSRYRILRAIVLAGLAIVPLSTNVFVAVDRIRVKLLEAPTAATSAQVRASTAGFPLAKDLRPPFALIARINHSSPGTSSFSIAVDGASVCTHDVATGGSRRVDCVVGGEWNPAIDHEVTIQGPPTAWTLETLEFATHHGSNIDGFHYMLVLPGASDRYVRPAIGWLLATWSILVAAILLLPAPPPMPRWIRLLYWVAVGAVVLELAVSVGSRWLSDYRIVLSAGTFTKFLVLLFAPRLWAAGRLVTQTTDAYIEARPTTFRRRLVLVIVAVLSAVGGVIGWELLEGPRARIEARWERFQATRRAADQVRARERLFAELQPVKLANCDFKRYGEPNDGGYVLCANLLADVQSGYSYGISGYDQWGCDVSHGLSVPVHEYDCFNLTVPICAGGRTVFHAECIGDKPATIEGRPFDTLENQFVKNGDGARRVVVKMDVEGAEWDSLLQTPDAVLERVDQLTIELHGVSEPERFLTVVTKLKRFFHIANIHYNNFACMEGVAPFPAEVYEVLFVSKRLAVTGGSGPVGAPRGMMTPNAPPWSDCQSLADLPPARPPGQ